MGSIRWTDEQIIAAMRDWETIFGAQPTSRDWMYGWAGEYPSAKTVTAHFGSWNAAKRLAFPPKRELRTDWTAETTLEALRQWMEEHGGLPPTWRDLTPKNDLPTVVTLERLHGSVAAALKKIGAPRLPLFVNRRSIKKYLPMRRT